MRDVTFEDWASARGPTLRRIARLLCSHAEDADDLVQETLVKTYVKWGRIRRMDNPEAYVRTILVNAHLSLARSRQRQQRRRHLWAASPPSVEAVPAIVERSALAGALSALGTRQRAVVVLRYYCDLADAEIADMLGCSTATVRSQAMRGLAHLRENAEVYGLGLVPVAEEGGR